MSASPVACTPACSSPTDNELGAFLRARRNNLTPEQAQIPVSGPRRMTGLRRDELAELAGVSAPYYTRLEQGRARRPSQQVVAALGRALQLGADDMGYLHRLAGHDLGVIDDSRPDPVTVLALQAAFEQLHSSAAYVVGPTGRVLLATDLARALCPGFVPGINSIAYLVLHPDAGTVLPGRPQLLREAVARLRYNAGNGFDPDGVQRLADQLIERSAEFRALWERHEVLVSWRGPICIRHEVTGVARFERVPLIVANAPAYRLHLLHPVDAAAQRALTGSG